MRTTQHVLSATVLFAAFGIAASPHAQVSTGVNVVPEPICPYGYFDYPPYHCAPDGYFGPEWFMGGHFIGAGKWFHAQASFRGNVNNHFDPKHGYKGVLPDEGPAQTPTAKFHANQSRDGRGQSGSPHK